MLVQMFQTGANPILRFRRSPPVEICTIGSCANPLCWLRSPSGRLQFSSNLASRWNKFALKSRLCFIVVVHWQLGQFMESFKMTLGVNDLEGSCCLGLVSRQMKSSCRCWGISEAGKPAEASLTSVFNYQLQQCGSVVEFLVERSHLSPQLHQIFAPPAENSRCWWSDIHTFQSFF